jgi:hypothetical protein
MNTTSTSYSTTSTPPLPTPVAGSGAGVATGPTGAEATGAALVAGSGLVGGPGSVVVPLDAFAKRGGPDVAIKTDAGMVQVHAVFQLDPSTRELSVSVVDESGRLIRLIPPESVSQMIAAMATYRGR